MYGNEKLPYVPSRREKLLARISELTQKDCFF
jgi:hypothetical protein